MDVAGLTVSRGTKRRHAIELVELADGTRVSMPALFVNGAAEGPRLRTALSIYNFSGDLGKMALPALTALLIALWQWRVSTALLGLIGLIAAAAIYRLLRGVTASGMAKATGAPAPPIGGSGQRAARHGFIAITAIGIVDATTRTGFLTFLPFLLTGKGADVPTIGFALALVFAGGATGKFVCGVVADRVGVIRTVVITEAATTVLILTVVGAPLPIALAVLIPLGIALNGTSSVLYGTVADLVSSERRSRAYGLYYTLTVGCSALAPTLWGLVGDAGGVPLTLTLVGLVVLATIPLCFVLRPAVAAPARS